MYRIVGRTCLRVSSSDKLWRTNYFCGSVIFFFLLPFVGPSLSFRTNINFVKRVIKFVKKVVCVCSVKIAQKTILRFCRYVSLLPLFLIFFPKNHFRCALKKTLFVLALEFTRTMCVFWVHKLKLGLNLLWCLFSLLSWESSGSSATREFQSLMHAVEVEKQYYF